MGRRSLAIGLALALAAVSVGLLAQRRRDADLARIAAGADELAPAAASSFVLPSLGGGTVALQQFRGKVLVVTFWATWCPPCRAEEPSLRKLARRFSPESFQLLAVSVDDDWESVDRFFAGRKPPYAVALDRDASVARSWGTTQFPESYVVDARGNLRLKLVGARDWTGLDTLALLHGLGAQGL